MSLQPDDDDMGELFRAYRKDRAEKREQNRSNSAALLRIKGFEFEEKNGGAHLIVKHKNRVVDFWPGTGKWQMRGTNSYARGVMKLLKALEQL